jgi:leucyl aminopeptidase
MVTFESARTLPDCDAVVVPVVEGRIEGGREVEAALGVELEPVMRDLATGSDDAPARVLPTLGRARFRAVVLVAIPPDRPGAVGLREAAMVAARACGSFRHVSTTLTQAGDTGAVEAVVEGATLGAYAFDRYRREVEPSATDLVTLVDPRLSDADVPIANGSIVASTTNFVRDLVNAPPADAPPLGVAELVAGETAGAGATARLVTGEALEQEGFAGLVAVGAGSHRPPCMLEIAYDGEASGRAPLVLAGKGITFDSGGLDLKPLEAMVTMKQDMAGAAAVAGAVLGAARLELPLRVTGLLALADNMPGGSAWKPGDVIRHRNGISTEVISPDAEGRVVLADVLAYGAESRPRAMVDVATLTGGGGLGPEIWAILGTDPELVDALIEAGSRVGDDGWQLPMWPAYRRYLRSSIADLRNSARSSRYGMPALSGAGYLRAFVGDVPWAHLDTSAVAGRTDADATAAWPVGATGSPVRALIEWLRSDAQG